MASTIEMNNDVPSLAVVPEWKKEVIEPPPIVVVTLIETPAHIESAGHVPTSRRRRGMETPKRRF